MQIVGITAGPFQTNTYVIVGQRDGENADENRNHNDNDAAVKAFVVDPGKDSASKAREIAARAGASIECIVLTHGHIDHTRDCAEFGVPVYIHREDEIMLDPQYGAPGDFARLFDTASMKRPDDLRYLETDTTMIFAGLEFQLVHAPGHSPGSTILVAQTEPVALTGDVIFAGTIGRTDLPLADPSAMNRTLAGPVWDLDDALDLLPGHGPATTMKRERTANPFLVEAGRSR